jgi:hypothetical protein
MKELLNRGFLEDISSKKIDYFFCSIYTIAYLIHKQPNWLDIDRRRMQNKIKNATNLAKNTLIDSLLRLERIQKNANVSSNIFNAVVSPIDKMIGQDDEEIDKLISKLREKRFSVEDIEQARLNNVRMLTIREMEGYDESQFEAQSSKYSQHYHKRSTSSTRELPRENNLGPRNTGSSIANAFMDDNYLDANQENDQEKEEEEVKDEGEEDDGNDVNENKGKDMDKDMEEEDKKTEEEDEEKEEDETKFQEVNSHRHKRIFEDISDNDSTSSDSYYEAEPKAELKIAQSYFKDEYNENESFTTEL